MCPKNDTNLRLPGRTSGSILKVSDKDGKQHLPSLKFNMEPKKWRFGRWFSFSTGWFSGSMLVFGGVNFPKNKQHRLMVWIIFCSLSKNCSGFYMFSLPPKEAFHCHTIFLLPESFSRLEGRHRMSESSDPGTTPRPLPAHDPLAWRWDSSCPGKSMSNSPGDSPLANVLLPNPSRSKSFKAYHIVLQELTKKMSFRAMQKKTLWNL